MIQLLYAPLQTGYLPVLVSQVLLLVLDEQFKVPDLLPETVLFLLKRFQVVLQTNDRGGCFSIGCVGRVSEIHLQPLEGPLDQLLEILLRLLIALKDLPDVDLLVIAVDHDAHDQLNDINEHIEVFLIHQVLKVIVRRLVVDNRIELLSIEFLQT
jgi:hypothetical protein